MTIKSDKWIKEKCTNIEHWERGMITPFYPESMSRLHGTEGKKVPSYGLSSYGYDVRLGKHFKIFGNTKPVFSEVDEWIACRKNEAGVMTRTIERAKDFAYKPHPTEIEPFNVFFIVYRSCRICCIGTCYYTYTRKKIIILLNR